MINQKELMIHVERIVRPVRAADRRKLQMRRELLAHLQAALEEESGHGGSEAEALAAAKTRLGNPVEITRSLQRSVPWMERILLAYVPVGSNVHRWEAKLGVSIGLGEMSRFQQSVLTLGTGFLACSCVFPLALRVHLMYENVIQQRYSESGWQLLAGNLASILLQVFLALSCFAAVARAARRQSWNKFALPAACAALCIVAWEAVLVILIAGQSLQWQDMALAIVTSVVLTALLALLGRLAARAGRDYHEWLTLDIAQ